MLKLIDTFFVNINRIQDNGVIDNGLSSIGGAQILLTSYLAKLRD